MEIPCGDAGLGPESYEPVEEYLRVIEWLLDLRFGRSSLRESIKDGGHSVLNPGSGCCWLGLGLFLEPGGRPGPRRTGGGSSTVLSGRDWIDEGVASTILALLGSGFGRTVVSTTRTSAGLLSRPLVLVSAPISIRITILSCSGAAFGPLAARSSRTLALSMRCFADCLASLIISLRMSGAFVMCCCERSRL